MPSPPSDFLLPLDQLPDPLPIPVIERPGGFDVAIRPPGSKSITNRALLLAALATGESTLRGALIDADDAQVMMLAVEKLGAKVQVERASSASGGLDVVRVTGVGGQWKIPAGETVTLDLHNAGTATRFLTAAAILADSDSGGVVIDGDPRMRERPIGELVDALRSINVQVDYVGQRGFPPVHVKPLRSLGSIPAKVKFGTTTSSQFISAMLLIAPFLPKGLDVHMPLQPTSSAYVAMSVMVMTLTGLERHSGDYCRYDFREDAHTTVHIRPQPWRAFAFEIEPDASGATYFEAAAALISGARTTIDGLEPYPPNERASLQGDTHFVRLVTAMGAKVERLSQRLRVIGTATLTPIDANLSDMPDTAMTAAVLACFASPTAENPTATSTLRGLRTLRVKETDRLEALRVELSKIGARVEVFKDGEDEGLRITPPTASPMQSGAPSHLHCLAQGGQAVAQVTFDTYNDHRMAMALALVGLRVPGVSIRNPGCVAKTYPGFWKDLGRLY